MLEHYNVERFDQVTAKQLRETGFTGDAMRHLESQGVTKGEIVAEMERIGDPNVNLDALIGNVLGSRQHKADGVQEAAPSEVQAPEAPATGAPEPSVDEPAVPEPAVPEPAEEAKAEEGSPEIA